MTRRIEPTPEFLAFCRGLHQDIALTSPDLEDLVRSCVNHVRSEDRSKLKRFLTIAEKNCTDSELKGLFRRSVTDWSFSSVAARALVKAALTHLERTG